MLLEKSCDSTPEIEVIYVEPCCRLHPSYETQFVMFVDGWKQWQHLQHLPHVFPICLLYMRLLFCFLRLRFMQKIRRLGWVTDDFVDSWIQMRALLKTEVTKGPATSFCWTFGNPYVLLLMEEILHQLIGSLSHDLQGFITGGAGFPPSTVVTSSYVQRFSHDFEGQFSKLFETKKQMEVLFCEGKFLKFLFQKSRSLFSNTVYPEIVAILRSWCSLSHKFWLDSA